MKKIDINKTVYELTQEYPELIDILAEIGFLGVKNPIVRNTLGRITTLKEGCKKQGKDIKEVIDILKNKGFEIIEEL
jgi:hypothetical protein